MREYVLAHKENLNSLVERMSRRGPVPGDNPNFVLELFDGWRVVMTLEQQPPPPDGPGWCYHISISVAPRRGGGGGGYPNPIAIEHQLLPLLGIKGTIKDAVNSKTVGNVVELWFKYEGPE